MVLLWTNSAPTSSFSAQTVQFDASGCELFIVKFAVDVVDQGYKNLVNYSIVEKDQTSTLVGLIGVQATADQANKYSEGRDIKVESTGATFSACYQRQWNTTSANAGIAQNTRNVPLKIWGLKL